MDSDKAKATTHELASKAIALLSRATFRGSDFADLSVVSQWLAAIEEATREADNATPTE